MLVKWANDGLLQAYDGEMLVYDGEMLVNDGEMLVNDVEMLVNDGEMLLGNDGEMSIWSYTHFTISPKKICWTRFKSWEKSLKQKLLEMVKLLFCFILMNFFFWSFKNGNGRQNLSSGAKSWLYRRTGAKT